MVLYSSNTGAVCGNFYVKWLISCAATHCIKKNNPIWYQNVSKYLDYTEDLER